MSSGLFEMLMVCLQIIYLKYMCINKIYVYKQDFALV